ncbi:methyltransferase domain-containing protein [Massilia sp. W12]|uniref:methyltransferase domain-containing protein n=1 Tax=Massilia sp. W12 TaxID=3126507 RepID=UPI0030D40AE9
MAYQSFPGQAGDSDSQAKLQALRLPALSGARVLDLGCNEGYFSAYAQYAGAREVIGIDINPDFIARARQRFPASSYPGLQFIVQSWEQLPPGEFDLILLTSSLHYATDQTELITRLMSALSPGGVLVLEIGVAAGEHAQWQEVARSRDVCLYPTWGQIHQTFAPWVWKEVGPSVAQAGDPIPRHVFHLRRRLPFAWLMLQIPGSGKSTISRALFAQQQCCLISGDQSMLALAAEQGDAADVQLAQAVRQDFNPAQLDAAMRRVLTQGLLPRLLAYWLQQAQGQDFALDAFLPLEYHAALREALQQAGYCPVQIMAYHPGVGMAPQIDAQQMAHSWRQLLAAQAAAANQDQTCVVRLLPQLPFTGVRGHWDHLRLADGRIWLSGWAVNDEGRLPRYVQIRIGQQSVLIDNFRQRTRVDVQQYFKLDHPMLGWEISLDAPADATREDLLRQISIYGGNDPASMYGPFGIAPYGVKEHP